MKAIVWLVVAGAGFALMAWSYFAFQRIDDATPWANGTMIVAEPGTDPVEATSDVESFAVPMRLLPVGVFATSLLQQSGQFGKTAERSLQIQFPEKLIRLSPVDAGIEEGLLAAGRLPEPGENEVLAGHQADHKDELVAGDQRLKVVGVLRRDAALFAESYLVPPHASVDPLFDLNDDSVRWAVLLRALSREQLADETFREQLKKAFPVESFQWLKPLYRVTWGAYLLYLAGLALLCFGGSGFLIGLYANLAARVSWRPLHDPLNELATRSRLLWSFHLLYFGLVMLAALVIYALPTLQTFLLTAVRGEIASGEGVLGVAGKAYATGNVPLAALVTFVINFFVGSVLFITLPSLIVPGCGVLLAAFRALLWGLLLAPTIVTLSSVMLPHSGTLLLEGEAYILAAFFGALVPVYLLRPNGEDGIGRRYARAWMTNIKGCLVVAIVLLIAACYEAIEVIAMSR